MMASQISFMVLIGVIGISVVVIYWIFLENGDLVTFSSTNCVGGNMLPRSLVPDYDRSDFLPPSLLLALKEAERPRNRKLISTCGMRGCGGLGDRTRGLAFVVGLAILTDRQFVVHPSIMTNMGLPLNFSGRGSYSFSNQCDERATLNNIESLLNATEDVVYITNNCFRMSVWEGAFKTHNSAAWLHLAELRQECSLTLKDAYYCGSRILHHVEEFRGPLSEARQFVEGLGMIFLKDNYTVIQIRAGGSNITIGDSTVKVSAWNDGYNSSLPEMWIEAFRTMKYSDCKKSIALISDSSRVLAEIRHAARDRIMINHCCSHPLHRDRTKRLGFFFQEVIDLLIMARSRRIIVGTGNFASLGRTWLEKEGPDLILVKDMASINDALQKVFKESQCLL